MHRSPTRASASVRPSLSVDSVVDFSAALFLDGLLSLVVESPSLGRARRSRRPALLCRGQRTEDEISKPRPRIFEVSLLGAGQLADHDDASLTVDCAIPRLIDQPSFHSRRNRLAITYVKTQVDLRRDLVDVLSSGPGRTDSRPFQICRRNGESLFDFKVLHRVATLARSFVAARNCPGWARSPHRLGRRTAAREKPAFPRITRLVFRT